ncbi:MAG: hypothetical protein ACLU5E_06745 [Anaerovoracaceae bacterium]
MDEYAVTCATAFVFDAFRDEDFIIVTCDKASQYDRGGLGIA